ncbi:MAG: hypothetical protein HY833_01985 [Candidatus Aenigmarchaeota archaeon]|nr:hypothetical protein [Candidatus Aenigmarchaeota archaeon]
MSAAAVWAFLSVFIVSISGVGAACVESPDWPGRPCYDTSPFPPFGEQKAAWQGYYEYKGAVWMGIKKLEMDESIKAGEVSAWASESDGNFNVWRYYYLNGQAPSLQTGNYKYNVWDSPYFQAAVVVSAAAAIYLTMDLRRAKRIHGKR